MGRTDVEPLDRGGNSEKKGRLKIKVKVKVKDKDKDKDKDKGNTSCSSDDTTDGEEEAHTEAVSVCPVLSNDIVVPVPVPGLCVPAPIPRDTETHAWKSILDEGSAAWRSNKRSIGPGTFAYLPFDHSCAHTKTAQEAAQEATDSPCHNTRSHYKHTCTCGWGRNEKANVWSQMYQDLMYSDP